MTYGHSVPIAIVGMGCRFPGGAVTPGRFWQLLVDGVDTVREVPENRFDIDRLYHAKPATPGRIATRNGAFLDEIDGFDPTFFGISPREAERMDPQQRLLLEVAWETFEDAGLPPERASVDERTGVFIGMMEAGYENHLFADPEALDLLGLNGAGRYGTAGRLSYVFHLWGPTLSVDTACSSSLVATHLACQALRDGEATFALAGGAQIMLQPAHSIAFSQGNMLALDGRCKFGDARADGFGRGEGVGLVLLERLDRALERGHKIYAVIRGGAVGSYGTSDGAMPRPNPDAQAANLRAAYGMAGVTPADVQYAEAHGTGTRAGDSVELHALSTVLGEGRPADDPFSVGSVKTNIAHAEGASGVAGLIKLALALHHRFIPKSLHFETPNPRIPWAELPLRVQAEGAPWPKPHDDRRRIGCVNNFGMSGTNAHLILEEAPVRPPQSSAAQDEMGPHLLPLSARSQEGLVALARAYEPLVTTADDTTFARITRAAATTRAHHAHRLAIVADDARGAGEALAAFAAGTPHPGAFPGHEPTGATGKVAFVFSGHGSQWLGMGRQLMASEPVFLRSIEASDAAIRRHAPFSLVDELRAVPEHSQLARNEVVQPVLFAMAVAIADLWRSWGIVPHAVVGHSMGEIAASHVAGALDLDDAARVACLRSQLLARVIGLGRMVMVELPEAEARAAIAGQEDILSVAVIQSSRATVLSGERVALEALIAKLEAKGVFCRWVKVDYASHSPHMEPLEADLLARLAPTRPHAGVCPMYSTLLGRAIDGAECDARYWYENLRRPVRFAGAIEQLVQDGHTRFVEISPHPLLLPSVAPNIGGGVVVPSLRREEVDPGRDPAGERRSMLESLGALYAAGHPVPFEARHGTLGSELHAVLERLPTYPFQRQKYWVQTRKRSVRAGHPLLGPPITPSIALGGSDAQVRLFDVTLGPDELPWVVDHAVEDAAVMPGAAFLEMALAAARVATAGKPPDVVCLADVQFETPLVFGHDGGSRGVQLALVLRDGGGTFTVSSRRPDDATWVRHAHGSVGFEPATLARGASRAHEPLAAVRARLTSGRDTTAFYEDLAARGLVYGPAFRGVVELREGQGAACAKLELPDLPARDDGYGVHPALLDAALHALLAALLGDSGGATSDGPWVPSRVRTVRAHSAVGPGTTAFSHAVVRERRGRCAEGDVFLYDASGTLVLELLGAEVVQLERRVDTDGLLFSLAVAPTPTHVGAPAMRAGEDRGAWLVLADAGGRADAVARSLEARGEAVVVVRLDAAAGTDAYAGVLASSFANRRCRGVVHFASLDMPDEPSLADVERGLDAGPGSVLHLVQAIVAASFRDTPRLWLVTRGAQPFGTRAGVSGSALLGLGRVIAYEHPDLRAARIDLPSMPFEGEADALAAAVVADGPTDEAVLRPEGLFAVQLVHGRSPVEEGPAPSALRADRTYLITGGLGGLGRTLATWLVERGAKHVLLLGRTGEPGPVAELSTGDAVVRFERADVANRDRLASILTTLAVPLGGVFHAAGVLDDGLLIGQSMSRFRGVMAPKILGAWNLHELTREAPLDHFVLYASAAGVVGTPGQSGYAAANAFLDGLAHHRRALGLQAVSIDWGAFSDVGLAAMQENRGERLRAQGFASLTPAEGVAILGELLIGGQVAAEPQIGVMRFDARQWLDVHPQLAGSTFFAKLAEQARRKDATKPGSVAQRMRSLGGEARVRELEAFVTAEAARVLRLDPSRIERHAQLRGAGFDSLMGLELRNRLEAGLGLKLPATLLWSHPSVVELATHLASEISGSSSTPLAAVSTPANDDGRREAHDERALEEKVKTLSEEEKEALLEKTLEELALD